MTRPASLPCARAEDIATHISRLAVERGGSVALELLDDPRAGECTVTYGALEQRTRAFAASLAALTRPGDRVLLLLETGLDYVAGFLGCLQAGLVAVPAFPPDALRPQHQARLAAMARDCGARVALIHAGDRSSAFETVSEAGAILLPVEEVTDDAGSGWQARPALGADIAFLQYTSGSTSTPKGVMVSNANLMANEAAIRTGLSIEAGEPFVSWLPLYHDMGLIGGLLQPLFNGEMCALMSPRHFLARPVRWLEAVSRFRGCISGGPDFAYRMCLERIDPAKVPALDLSSWKVAFSGAEPVRAATMEAFARRFAPLGFAAEAVHPCYGLAEATLFVTSQRRGEGLMAPAFDAARLAEGAAVAATGDGMRVVACGVPAPDHGVRIRDPQTGAELPEGHIGEVIAHGPSIARGYWQNAEATAAAFPEMDGHRALRTGDLGFLQDGRLYLAGRAKDLIIVRGQNLYPHDIEEVIEREVDLVRQGRIAAFPVTLDAGEAIGVAVEISRRTRKSVSAEAIATLISEVVADAVQEPARVVVLLEPGTLPRTSSGKLQRSAVARGYIEGTLAAYAIVQDGVLATGTRAATPDAPVAADVPRHFAALAAIWGDILGRSDLTPASHFFALGGNSVEAMRVRAAIGERLGLDMPTGLLFRAPRLGELATALEGLAPVASGHNDLPAQNGPAPLTAAQRRMWFLSEIAHSPAARAACHVAGGLRFAEPVDREALALALDDVVARHGALRTRIRAEAGIPLQEEVADARIVLDYADLSQDMSGSRYEDCARAQAEAPFALGQAPLARALLVRRPDGRDELLVTLHHIICDGWSLDLLTGDLSAAYAARRAGSVPHLPHAPSFAALARREGEPDAADLAFWCAQLADAPHLTTLPCDHGRPAEASQVGGRIALSLTPELTGRLRALAAQANATLPMAMLALWTILIHRLAGSRDLCIGVAFANRTLPGSEGAVGLFVNTLPLRLAAEGAAAFAEMLLRVRTAVMEAEAHQQVPLERIVDALSLPRSLSRQPLFQTLYSHLPGRARVGLETFTRESGGQQFDFALETAERGDGSLDLAFGYALDLYRPATARRYADAFIALARAAVDAPASRLDGLPLVSPQALATYAAPWPWEDRLADAPVHDLISRQARHAPDAPAIIFGDETVRFGALDARANRLARLLLAQGVGAETVVGVGLPRGPDLIAALLAVWKAGGAFVPFDPDHPTERTARMLADAGVRLVLAAEGTADGFRRIDPTLADLSGFPDTPPDLPTHPEQLAYVIFTSGSTGRPKGVMVPHGALSMHCRATGALYETAARTREFHFLSMSFDGAHERWIVPLIHGGAIILTDRTPWPEEQTLDTLARHRATHAGFPPAYLGALAEAAAGRASVPEVDIYSFGGEAMTAAGFARIAQTLRPRLMINGYGPTEAVISPLAWKVPAQTSIETAHAPIGRAVGTRRAYVLDEALNPVPPGVPGELYIAGTGIARGYRQMPAATAERFLPDPFGPPGSRMYRTGDRARWREDGTVDYLGRTDRQIKLRGFRIEPGEVEAALRTLPGVRAAAVALKRLGPSDQLVGYVTGVDLDPAALRSLLARQLPDHMVPARLLVLDALPLTPNGKVDHQALPVPERPVSAAPAQAAEGDTEQALAAIWQDVLRLPAPPDRDANFFELGGDSILSLQIAARARRAGLVLSARDLFEHQTLSRLALCARREAPAPRHDAPDGPAPLTLLQRRFLETAPVPGHFAQTLRLTVRAPLDAGLLDAALRHVLNRHAALRLRFSRDGAGHWRQKPGPELDGPVLTSAEAESLDAAAALFRPLEAGMDIAHGPLVRALLARLPDGTQVLFLAGHHLVVDAVTWRILLEEIEATLADLARGHAPGPAETGASFNLRARHVPPPAQSPFPAALPPDDPSAPNLFGHRRDIRLAIPGAQTENLYRVARAHHARIDDLLLAAVVRASGRLRGRPAVTVGLERHGRDLIPDADFSLTAGWFTALATAAVPLEDDLRLAILAAKEAARAAVPDAEAPAPAILFNHLGRVESRPGARLVLDAIDLSADDGLPLGAELTVDALEDERGLELRLTAAVPRWQEATLTRLAAALEADLHRLAALESDGASPSDFPLARLPQATLDRLALPWREIADLYPLTPTQQGIFFHALDEAASGAYVNQLRLTLGGLDGARFAAAFARAVARHDILRTGFLWTADLAAPLQAVWRQVPFAVREAPPVAPSDTGALDAIATAERAAGFALAQPPLMRVCLVPLEGGGHHLIWTSHHLLLDGWSSARLMAEVLADYAGADVPPPAARFRDHVARLAAPTPEAEAFWRRRLSRLEEPTLLAAPAREPARIGHMSTPLEPALWERLRATARDLRITPNILFQAAFALVLRHVTQRADIAFGVTYSGRPEDDVRMESVLGLFITTVPAILHVPGGGCAADFLRAVQEEAVALSAHSATPLVDILRWAGRSGGALFDALMVFENYPMDAALRDRSAAGLTFGPVRSEEATNFPLTLSVITDAQPRLDWSFDSARLQEPQVAQFGARLLTALDLLSGNPQADLSAFSLASNAERATARAHGAAMTPPAPFAPVHERIADMARVQPEAIALTQGAESVSYGALDRQVELLARRLAAAGAGAGQMVGLCAERSPALVAGILAILRTGAAYLPLDPLYPEARLAHMIADAGASLLLCDDAGSARLPQTGLRRIPLAPSGQDDGSAAAMRPWASPHPDQPAYVIYTSGSTGTPKGVVVTHGNVARLLEATAPWFAFGAQDVWTLFHAYGFDFSVWEMFGALAHGGRLVVVPPAVSRAPDEFLDLLVSERVTVLNQTPSAFRGLMQAALSRPEKPDLALRTIIFGGEALDVAALAPWYARFGTQARLVNMYGITETTVHVTYRPLAPEDVRSPHRSPIGIPIPDLSLHLLDDRLDPVPVGTPGELCVGGAGLAAGYLGRPALTAGRFVPDPYGPPGSRLYLSGDRAVRRADGTLDYLGRGDGQVKIRGFRIELGEIEARLRAEPGVLDAVVIVRTDAAGQSLAGYVVTDGAIDLAHLRERLKASLPDHMVPALTALDALPLTANGKLDHAALPAPGATADISAPPDGADEMALAGIWAEVLGVPRIGRDDNFFALGGHSLSATQVRLEVRARLGVDVPVRRLFECQTLRSLAEVIAELRAPPDAAVPAAVPMEDALARMDALLSDLED